MKLIDLVQFFCRKTEGESSESNESYGEGYRVVLLEILPITALLLADEKLEVRQSAGMALVDIAQFIHADDVGQHVLTIILVQ